MKRVLVALLSFISFLAVLPQMGVVYAGNALCPTGGDFANLPGCGGAQIDATIVGKIVTILLILAVVLCLFFLIWGGIRWIISGGEKAKVDAARQTIIAAIVGLVIALLAYFILNLVVTVVTGKPLQNLDIPSLV
jgi:amino acid transporter